MFLPRWELESAPGSLCTVVLDVLWSSTCEQVKRRVMNITSLVYTATRTPLVPPTSSSTANLMRYLPEGKRYLHTSTGFTTSILSIRECPGGSAVIPTVFVPPLTLLVAACLRRRRMITTLRYLPTRVIRPRGLWVRDNRREVRCTLLLWLWVPYSNRNKGGRPDKNHA